MVAFDYDYMKGGKGGPGQMPMLIANHRAALEQAKRDYPVPASLTSDLTLGLVLAKLRQTLRYCVPYVNS